MATLDEELSQSGVQVRIHAEGPVEGMWRLFERFERVRLDRGVTPSVH